MEEFLALRARVEATRGNNRSAVTDLLKHIRTNRMREPQLVLSLWSSLSASHSSLGDEQWTVLEQVCLAALDVQDAATARDCLRELRLKFPESARVRRLVGMEREAAGEFEQAEAVYRDMLEANPANQAALKRQVCCLKSRGDFKGAIQKLNAYLKMFQSDHAAWQELAELYLAISKYEAAAFCYEECLLANPTNHIFHCRLAEIYYTMGPKYLRTARKYFAQSLNLKKNNSRALHGLAACCSAISVAAPDKKVRQDVTSALHEYASEELTNLYSSSPLKDQVEKLLQAQRESVAP